MTNINGVAYRPARSYWHDHKPLAAVSVTQNIILAEPAKTTGSAASLRTVRSKGCGWANDMATNAIVARMLIPLNMKVGVCKKPSVAFSPGSAPLSILGPTQVVYRCANPKNMSSRVGYCA